MNQRLIDIHRQDILPRIHTAYLESIESIQPKVIYDIGSCVLHWHRKAKLVWPASRIICFDALSEVSSFYNNIEFHCAVLSDLDNKEVEFFYNVEMPGGCSYYQENKEINAPAARFYNDSHKRKMSTITLDSLINNKQLPLPDLIKIDVQGAELDVVIGAKSCMATTKDVILELQSVDFNKGAPKYLEVIDYMKNIGFRCVTEKFSVNRFDADYHFKNERFE